jgi:HAD superfamily hydrolase (TIGR01549 family)
MKVPRRLDPADWGQVSLVVFDVDGTLYDQKMLHTFMLRELAVHAWRMRSLGTLTVLARYRRLRERLGNEHTADFEPVLLARTAAATGHSEAEVSAIVAEWIDVRPLPFLGRARFPGVSELFDALRQHGKRVGVLSDYPVRPKLEAMALEADYSVSATDPDVGLLKPHPRGLQKLMELADATPAGTVVIGDRIERDGYAASRTGTACLIKSAKARPPWQCFRRFDDQIFAPILRCP